MEIRQVVKPISKERGYYLKEAAELLGCDPQTIRGKIKKGVIPKDYFNGKIFISEASLRVLEQS